MKKLFIHCFLIVALISVTLISKSQNIKITEPEFTGTIVYVNSEEGDGLPLEPAKMSVKTKASASMYVSGIGKITSRASVKGETSTVRIKQGASIQFIYKANDNSVNPIDVIQLIRFEKKSDNRVTELGSVGTFSGASKGDLGFVEFTAKKYGTSSYIITVTNIAKGEYGFSLGKDVTTTIHMFTVE